MILIKITLLYLSQCSVNEFLNFSEPPQSIDRYLVSSLYEVQYSFESCLVRIWSLEFDFLRDWKSLFQLIVGHIECWNWSDTGAHITEEFGSGLSQNFAHTERIALVQPSVRHVVLSNDQNLSRVNKVHALWLTPPLLRGFVPVDCGDDNLIE